MAPPGKTNLFGMNAAVAPRWPISTLGFSAALRTRMMVAAFLIGTSFNLTPIVQWGRQVLASSKPYILLAHWMPTIIPFNLGNR